MRSRIWIGATSAVLACNPVDDAEEPSLELTWEPCGPRLAGGADGDCALAPLPLRASDPDGPAVEISVKRFLADAPVGQVWLLDGGPGGNGWVFESPDVVGTGRSFVDHLRERGWDVYVPSHRGTGLSTPLSCAPYQDWTSADGPWLAPEEVEPCAAALVDQWGAADLAAFDSAEAAEDVVALADAVRAVDGGQQALYGVSYGGYWAQRAMKAHPTFWDAVVMDSPLVLGADVEHTDLYASQSVERLFSEVCAHDPACTAHLGDDPLTVALDALTDLDAGAGCPGLELDADQAVSFLQVMVGSFPASVAMAPPMVARLDRCSASDVAELQHMTDYLSALGGGSTSSSYAAAQHTWGGPAPTTDAGDPAEGEFNAPLSNNVIALDLWPTALDVDALREETLAEPFALFYEGFAESIEAWPRPDDRVRDDALPVTDGALLVTQGGLDLATTPDWSARLASALHGPGQWRVMFPIAGHQTTFWTADPTAGTSCALSVQLAFLDDPASDPTLDCIEDRLDFGSEAAIALASAVFGTAELWGTPDP